MSFVPSTFVFSIIAFLILLALLRKYAFGPIFGMMEQRKTLVLDQLAAAETGRKQAEQLVAEQKEAIQQARKDAYDIIEQAKLTSGKLADDIVQQAKQETSRMKADALSDIESEKNKAIASLRSQVSGMAVLIASKIVEKQVDEKAQKALIDQYLKEVGGKQ